MRFITFQLDLPCKRVWEKCLEPSSLVGVPLTPYLPPYRNLPYKRVWGKCLVPSSLVGVPLTPYLPPYRNLPYKRVWGKCLVPSSLLGVPLTTYLPLHRNLPCKKVWKKCLVPSSLVEVPLTANLKYEIWIGREVSGFFQSGSFEQVFNHEKQIGPWLLQASRMCGCAHMNPEPEPWSSRWVLSKRHPERILIENDLKMLWLL